MDLKQMSTSTLRAMRSVLKRMRACRMLRARIEIELWARSIEQRLSQHGDES